MPLHILLDVPFTSLKTIFRLFIVTPTRRLPRASSSSSKLRSHGLCLTPTRLSQVMSSAYGFPSFFWSQVVTSCERRRADKSDCGETCAWNCFKNNKRMCQWINRNFLSLLCGSTIVDFSSKEISKWEEDRCCFPSTVICGQVKMSRHYCATTVAIFPIKIDLCVLICNNWKCFSRLVPAGYKKCIHFNPL